MLSDLLTTFRTNLSPHLRALGYFDEALALRRRYRGNRDSWQPHLDASRQFVLSAAGKCRSRNRIVILGSGLLLDVPLPELAEMFREVVLADVVCLPEARKQMKQFRNVSFQELDATGCTKSLYLYRQEGVSQLPAPVMPARAIENADLVVSLNILSQLWVIPRSFAACHMRDLPQEQIDDWCRTIVEAHYAWLRSLSCDVCLVADFAQVKCERSDEAISRSSTIYDLPLPVPEETWTWNIAPLSRHNPHHSKELVVGGWYFGAH